MSENPFVEYAAINWAAHFNASEANETNNMSADAVVLCSAHTPRFKSWAKIYWSSFSRSVPRTTTKLLEAASFDLIPVIQLLAQGGENVGQVDEDGDTALHAAAISKHERAIRELINLKAPINAKAKDGNTPLHTAAAWGGKVITELLLSHGADIHIRNNDDQTPLHRAAEFGHADSIRPLVNAGAHVNDLDSKGHSPLHWASIGYSKPQNHDVASLSRFIKTMQVLEDEGADPNLKDREGKMAEQLTGDSFLREVLRSLVKEYEL
jgi:hypothetical protein